MSDPEEVIASAKNAVLKRVRAAQRGKEPGVVVLEGRRLVEDAASAGVGLDVVLVEEGAAAPEGVAARVLRRVRAGLLDGLGGLKTAPGVLALAHAPARRGAEDLGRVAGAGPSTLLVIAGVQDPGNLGALARSAEAFGAAALVVVGEGARPFGPKALRGSMGSLLRLPVVEVEDAAGALDALEAAGVTSYAAATRGGASLWDTAFAARAALWVTGETGEGPAVLARTTGVTIPMGGAVESLNAAVAGALLLHERARQRGQGGAR